MASRTLPRVHLKHAIGVLLLLSSISILLLYGRGSADLSWSTNPPTVPDRIEIAHVTTSFTEEVQPSPIASWTASEPSGQRADPYCSAFPDPGNIAIALKTGATEAIDKVPAIMLTTLRCAQNVMIFSDLNDTIAGYPVHDALQAIPEAAMEGNSEFDFYKRLKVVSKYGGTQQMLENNRDAAWTLDKYKQLHILEQLYATYPKKDWYLMIDADTYLVWSNLLTWLPQMADPQKEKLYLGAVAMIGDLAFAHGGSGILLAHATMYDFAVTHAGAAARWDKRMRDRCCGDAVIAEELREHNITVMGSWPTINGEKPATLPFGPSHWCQPVVTMHHISPVEINQVYNYELARLAANITQPMIFADLYHELVRNTLPEGMSDWDNVPGGLGDAAEAATFEECQKMCEKNEKCFQFLFSGEKECKLGDSAHLGAAKGKDQKDPVRSGWLRDRIDAWVSAQSKCEVKFPHTKADPSG